MAMETDSGTDGGTTMIALIIGALAVILIALFATGAFNSNSNTAGPGATSTPTTSQDTGQNPTPSTP